MPGNFCRQSFSIAAFAAFACAGEDAGVAEGLAEGEGSSDFAVASGFAEDFGELSRAATSDKLATVSGATTAKANQILVFIRHATLR